MKARPGGLANVYDLLPFHNFGIFNVTNEHDSDWSLRQGYQLGRTWSADLRVTVLYHHWRRGFDLLNI